jgi:hypothetical protein
MKTDPEKAARWRKHIEVIKSSGSTRRAYCEKNGLNISTLDYWCRRLNSPKKNERDGAEWIPLKISEDEPARIDLRIGKVTIGVRSGFDPRLLKELLRTLGAQC